MTAATHQDAYLMSGHCLDACQMSDTHKVLVGYTDTCQDAYQVSRHLLDAN